MNAWRCSLLAGIAAALAGCSGGGGGSDAGPQDGGPDAGSDTDTGTEEQCDDADRVWKRVIPPLTSASLHAACTLSDGSTLAVGESEAGVWLRLQGDDVSVNSLSGMTAVRGLWCGPDGQAVAVGESAGTSSPIMRFDGTEWSEMDAPSAWSLGAVHGVSEDALWAVGGNGFVAAFDGVSWSEIPDAVPYYADLTGVWSAEVDDVHVVGCVETGYKRGSPPGPDPDSKVQFVCMPVAFRYHDGAWSQTLGLEPDTEPAVLAGIWGRAADDIWAAGYHDYDEDTAVLYHFDGAAWTDVAPPDLPGLTCVSGDADRVVAGAMFHTGWENHGPAQILEYDGTSWSAQVIEGWYGIDLEDIIWTGGGDWTSGGPSVAVGTNGALLRREADAWRSLNGPTNIGLSAISGAPGGDVFAVGGTGLVLRGRGAEWEVMPTPTISDLYSVWAASEDDVFVGAPEGTVLRWDGTGWTEDTSLRDATSYYWAVAVDMWGVAGPDLDLFAICEDGAIARFQGGTWQQSFAELDDIHLFHIWGLSENDVYAVGTYYDLYDPFTSGDTGVVLHYDGWSWQFMEVPDLMNISAIWGVATDDLHAFGWDETYAQGGFLHFDGTEWSVSQVMPWQFVNDMTGFAADDAYALIASVESPNRLIRFDGETWEDTGTVFGGMSAMWGASPADLYVVGAAGTIFHTECP